MRSWNRTDLDAGRIQGLVLIDELDVHMHVRMQKMAFPCLIKMFPGLQFIIATHSPYILNSAKNAVVYDMENHRELTRSDAEYGLSGWAIDSVLNELLGVHSDSSDEICKHLEEYDKAFNEEDEIKAH